MSEEQIQETIEEELLLAEKAVKKRKLQNTAAALDDDAKKSKTQDSGAAASSTAIVDLLSESEDDKMGEDQPVGKPNRPKNLEAEAKKQAKKEAAEAKKAENKKKKEIAVENKKLVSLASKVVASLNQAFKTAHTFEQEIIAKGMKPEDDEPQWKAFQEANEDVEVAKTCAVEILQKSAKGTTDPLPKLAFYTVKEGNGLIRILSGHVTALKTMFKPAKPAKPAARPKGAKGNKGQGKGVEA